MRLIRKKSLSLLYVVLFLVSFITTISYADTWNITWSIRDGKNAFLNASQYFLDSDWNNDVFDNARDKWNSSNANLYIGSTNWGSATLDFYSVSEEQWTKNKWDSDIIAWAQLWDTPTQCNSNADEEPDVICSSADYGAVYVNAAQTPANADYRAGILAHEIGHIIGLKHTSTPHASIMHTGESVHFRIDPTNYDINEVNGKYY